MSKAVKALLPRPSRLNPGRWEVLVLDSAGEVHVESLRDSEEAAFQAAVDAVTCGKCEYGPGLPGVRAETYQDYLGKLERTRCPHCHMHLGGVLMSCAQLGDLVAYAHWVARSSPWR